MVAVVSGMKRYLVFSATEGERGALWDNLKGTFDNRGDAMGLADAETARLSYPGLKWRHTLLLHGWVQVVDTHAGDRGAVIHEV